MRSEVVESLSTVKAAAWNGLERDANPFLSHEFLLALETQGCLGEAYGWFPHYILIRNDGGDLIAATPAYVKTNSYGEFVFDWAWAEAYQRNGLAYYPKLVVGVPYNPVTGPRLLLAPGQDPERCRRALHEAVMQLRERLQLSGVHWLFTSPEETRLLEGLGLDSRLGCQYHWQNQGFRDFDDYLDAMLARKRKSIRRERQRPAQAGVELQISHGDSFNDEDCALIHRFYESTFEKKWGIPTLSAGFFRELARTLGPQLVVVFAWHQGRRVAAAIMLRSERALYGRFWGCEQTFHSLHFEACYYQGIDYCIREGLQRFEPGAQGEHKISRGFLPTPTWSAHWLEDSRFRPLISRYLRDEREAMRAQCESLHEMSPFRGDRKH